MKYIIDIEDKPFTKKGEVLYKAKCFNSLVFDEKGLNKMKPFETEAFEIIEEVSRLFKKQDGETKAEQMFMSMGYRKVEGEIYTRYEKRHEDRIPEYISFWQSDQTMNCSAIVNKALFDAMLQQCRELGWYE